jgi:predicted esterase
MAPEAANHTWYPYSFLAPLSQNEPGVSSALRLILGLVDKCEAFGIPSQRVAIVGFSQGACLASEFVARYPRRFAGLIAFTGGLLGPPGSNLQHSGSLAGTEVLLSAGDRDPHVPWQRVEETAERFRDMEALVKVDKYPGKPHSVSAIEVSAARNILYSALTY